MPPRFTNYNGGAGETAPGVAVLRQLWDIPTGPPARQKAPENVSTDIYSVPNGAKPVPRRRFRQR